MSFSIDPFVILATFAIIFPAELPDKSMFASVVLATRFRPWPVFIGLGVAFLLHGIIAVTAGSVVLLLPHRVVEGIVTVFFAIGAFILLFKSEAEEEQEGEDEAEEAGTAQRSDLAVIATSFGVVFASEWGDLTQIATINLTARYNNALSVLIGSVGAEWAVCGLGVLLGQRLVKTVPLAWVRRLAGVLLAILAIWSFYGLIRG